MVRFVRPLKYLFVFTLPILAYMAFHSRGWMTFLPLLEAFLIVPLLELLFKPDEQNMSAAEEEMVRNDRIYDGLVYAIVPVQIVFVYWFLQSMGETGLSVVDKIGRISAMGLMCGVIGINVAHELGHRTKKYEQFMSKILLLSSLYMHFFIEHNRGHHKNVSTPDDPASSRKGESLYAFWLRSVWYSYWSAWKLEADRLNRKNKKACSLHNEMLWYQLIQLALVASIWVFFGLAITLCFLAAAAMGILLLETVNYIEHYGLQREKTEQGVYERVLPAHSWNSNHIVGRMMLFDLSRHSDHHYLANRKYQILRHMENAPQMPTGYPGMMIMACLPPLWFAVMNNQIKKFATANV